VNAGEDVINRRRFLYLLGATSAVGFAGYGAADEYSDGQDHNEHEHDHDDGHHEDNEAYEGKFNHADIEFMQMMIHHHEQAIEMAELIPGRTDRQEL
jgi:uncharacterized protein (DUF305 family)